MDEQKSEHVDRQKPVGQKLSWLMRPIEVIVDIFEPIIPVILAGGLLIALYNLLVAKGLFYSEVSILDIYPQYVALADTIGIFASAPFVFLPILLGFSATRTFGGNPYLGAALGMTMVHPVLMSLYEYGMGSFATDPSLASATGKNLLNYWSLIDSQGGTAGLTVAQVGYQGTVLPVLLMSWILAKLERFFQRFSPSFLGLLVPALLALFITSFITFLFLGPIFLASGSLLAQSMQLMYETSGAVGGALFGVLYAPIAITGLNYGFPALETSQLADMAKTGGSFILPLVAINSIAQGGAALAALFTSKDSKLRGVASVGGVSAMMGIAEPAIFGVNLRLRYPFFAAIISAGLGAAYAGYTGVKSSVLGGSGMAGIAGVSSAYLTSFVIGLIIAFGCAFIGTIFFSRTILNPERYSNNKRYPFVQGKKVITTDIEIEIDGDEEQSDDASLAIEKIELQYNDIDTTTATENNLDDIILENTTTTSDHKNDEINDDSSRSDKDDAYQALSSTEVTTVVGAGVSAVLAHDAKAVAIEKQSDSTINTIDTIVETDTISVKQASEVKDLDNPIKEANTVTEEKTQNTANEKNQTQVQEKEDLQVVDVVPDWIMPMKGEVVALSDVPDDSFASGDIGAGFAINPTNGTVVAPITSIVSAVFPDNQAICLENQRGVEILIHVGVDTDRLAGKGFKALVEEGNVVPAGIPLLEVDLDAIRDEVPSLLTSVLFTYMTEGEEITVIDGKPMLKI